MGPRRPDVQPTGNLKRMSEIVLPHMLDAGIDPRADIFNRLLRNRVSLYLGRVSYPLYLVHIVIVAIVFRLTPEPWIAAPVVIVVSLLLADLIARTVEVPANRYGKKLARRFFAPRPAPALPASLATAESERVG